MSAIYIHIPFCKKICAYCDFFRVGSTEQMPQTIDAMLEELTAEQDFINDKELRTIYFGGGTPSLLRPQDVERFLIRITELFDTTHLEEITLEANPDDLTPEYLDSLRKVGINRLSIGIQSFDDEELRFMNRRHNSQQAIDAIHNARRAGFDNIAIDLIFGVAGFGVDILNRSIDIAINLDVEHIAAYHLTIEPNTKLGQRFKRGEISLVEEEQSHREYMLLHHRLTQAGYNHYEISNYAKPERESRHNSSYWQGVEYLGIGAGAHSFNGEIRRWGVDSINRYLAGGTLRHQSERLSLKDRQNEMILTSLRCSKGIDLEKFGRVFGEEARARVTKSAKRWLESAELVIEYNRLYIPHSHFLISDMIIESLFE